MKGSFTFLSKALQVILTTIPEFFLGELVFGVTLVEY
jgi:hypothetical protein